MGQPRRYHTAHHHTSGSALSTRPTKLALAVTALLAAGPAASIEIDTVPWSSDVAGYLAYASTCPLLGGSQCGADSSIPPSSQANNFGGPGVDGAIYSFGAAGDDARNSIYTWRNEEGYAFRITGVQIQASGEVGTPPAPPTTTQPVGTGALATWEQGNAIRDTKIADMRVQITAGANQWTLNVPDVYQNEYSDPMPLPGGYTTTNTVVYRDQLVTVQPEDAPNAGKHLFLAPTVAGQTWFDGSDVTYQTPIDRTFGATGDEAQNTINADDLVQIRLFETQEDSVQDVPDAILSNVQITIQGATADLRAQGVNFKDVRVGAGTATGNATVENTDGNGGFRALDVAIGGVTTPGSKFSGTGNSVARLETGDPPLSAQFDFLPTVIDKDTILTETIDVTSYDAGNTTVQLSGRGVGPQINASVDGSVPDPDFDEQTINFGTEYVGDTSEDPALLSFSNLFGDDLDTLTDLTLALDWLPSGDFLIQDLLGNTIDSGDRFVVPAIDTASAAFNIYFTPTDTGNRSLDLTIATDQRAAFAGLGTAPLNGNSYTIHLEGVGEPKGPDLPAPGSLALLGLGLAGLRFRRR